MKTTEQDCLLVLDSRTGKSYQISIKDNAINATDVGKITIPDVRNGEDASQVPVQPLRVLDRGFENTACMVSQITVMDGHRGEIRFRDYPIQDLFHEYMYEDVMHLLLWGSIPTRQQKDEVRAAMAKAMSPPDTVINHQRHQAVRVRMTSDEKGPDSETYNMILAGMSAFASADVENGKTRHQQRPMYHNNLEVADAAIVRTIGYVASTVALVYCHKRGKTFNPPQEHRSLIGNLLLMIGFFQPGDGQDSHVEACLDKLWILYADSEITCSTAAVLHAGSSLIDPTSCAIAGIVCGHGPLHGGAIELAYEGFEQIGKPENVLPLLEAVKQKKARLFGYGHRVLKQRDPRAALIKEVMPIDNCDNPLLQIALSVDRAPRKDPYFVERGLHANIDLYGSFPYLALGFEKDIVTSVIILSRVPGGLAHWRESLQQPVKLWHPQQIYKENTKN